MISPVPTLPILRSPFAPVRGAPPLAAIARPFATTAALPPVFEDDEGATVDLPGDAAGEGAIWLSLADGADHGPERSVLLSAGEAVVVGTGTAADVQLRDATVSGRHCRVAHVGHGVEVSDLGSRNGVRVGGARVGHAVVPVGGVFDLGRTRVRIDPAASPAPWEGEAAPLAGVIGGSRSMRRLAAAVRRAAALRLPVLVRGESGTGKDLVARALHEEGARAAGPFVAINAAAIARELAESELFGHKRGAFTGAVRDRRGAFREAHGGTLFLDEIAALPMDLQAKLLRAVEEGTVRPVGAEAPARVDVRLVAATCEPIESLVEERRFRADLYERLAVCVVRVPPLRDRIEDVDELGRHLLAASELATRALSPGALALLRAHRWPGNVRELRNVVVQAALRSGTTVLASDVAAVLADRAEAARRRLRPTDALRFFEEAGHNVSAAARRAALPRSTMRDLLRAAGVSAAPRAGACEARPLRPLAACEDREPGSEAAW